MLDEEIDVRTLATDGTEAEQHFLPTGFEQDAG
jgi:hypothetical protein